MFMKTPSLEFRGSRALAGFSLIELLMAAVIASSAAALLIGVLISANRQASLRKEQAVASQVLATQLALLDDALTSATPSEGACAAAPSGCRWKLEHTPTVIPQLEKVVLTVETEGRSLRASTYRRLIEPQGGS